MTSDIKSKYCKAIYGILLCLFMYLPAYANTIAHCDTLIKQGIEAMWKKDYVKSLELLTEARVMAEQNHWYKQLFLATNNIGNTYYSMLDYGEALNYYLDGYNVALKEREPTHEMVVLNNIAILYSKEKNFDKAKEYFKKAYDIARENKNKVKIGLYAMNLGNLANEAKRPAEAREYILESLPYIEDDPHLMTMAQLCLAENDLLLGNPGKARQKAENLYRNAKDLTQNDVGISLLIIIAKSYLAEKDYEKAALYAGRALGTKPNLETRETIFVLMCDIYTSSNELRKALQYKDSLLYAQDELNNIKNGRQFENSRVKFEIQNYKEEIANKEEKLSTERKLFYSIIAVIIAVVTIIILTLRNRSIKHKQRKLIAERSEKVIALELEKEKTENLLLEKQISEKETASLLEQERLRNEIEARNRKLSAKALYLVERNQLIEEFITSLAGISKDASLAKPISELKKHLKTDEEWDSFVVHFEEVNHGFINQLRHLHPSLNANDIRFISYIYMNLSSKEIATMLNITAEAYRKRKERIAAKMELPENVSLYNYLSTL